LAPENKWEFAALIVPTARESANRAQQEKQRAALLEDLNHLQTAETPEQGNELILLVYMLVL